jgi:hypothetical protein
VHQTFITGNFLLWQMYVPEWILQPVQIAAWLFSNGYCFLCHHCWQSEYFGAATEISIDTWVHKMVDSRNKFFIFTSCLLTIPIAKIRAVKSHFSTSILPKYYSWLWTCTCVIRTLMHTCLSWWQHHKNTFQNSVLENYLHWQKL